MALPAAILLQPCQIDRALTAPYVPVRKPFRLDLDQGGSSVDLIA